MERARLTQVGLHGVTLANDKGMFDIDYLIDLVLTDPQALEECVREIVVEQYISEALGMSLTDYRQEAQEYMVLKYSQGWRTKQ